MHHTPVLCIDYWRLMRLTNKTNTTANNLLVTNKHRVFYINKLCLCQIDISDTKYILIKSFGKEVDFEYQRIESISNFAASIDIFKVFYLIVKHIVTKIERFRPKAVKPSSG